MTATPIGHADDITLRALDMFEAADLILCEDTRVTARLLALYGIKADLLAYHDHNAARMRPRILETLQKDGVVVLVSDAGTPLVSDPGYKLVREAAELEIAIHAVPGASSVLAALTMAGLPTDRFLFAGFLPSKTMARKTELEKLAAVPATLVFFETGPRLADSLAQMAESLGGREAVLLRELTKRFEEAWRGSLETLAEAVTQDGPPKGEIVLVVGPPLAPQAIDDAELDERLRVAMAKQPLKAAVTAVTAVTGLPRRTVYQRALTLKAAGEDA